MKRDDSPYGPSGPKHPRWMNEVANDLFHIGNHFVNNFGNVGAAINQAIEFESTPAYEQWSQDIERKLYIFRRYPILWGYYNINTLDLAFWESIDDEFARRWINGLSNRRNRKEITMYTKPPLVNPRTVDIVRIIPCTLDYSNVGEI